MHFLRFQPLPIRVTKIVNCASWLQTHPSLLWSVMLGLGCHRSPSCFPSSLSARLCPERPQRGFPGWRRAGSFLLYAPASPGSASPLQGLQDFWKLRVKCSGDPLYPQGQKHQLTSPPSAEDLVSCPLPKETHKHTHTRHTFP